MLGAFLTLILGSASAQIAHGKNEVAYYADAYATHYGVPRELVHAIVGQESGWRVNAVSVKGAMGLMQLMPQTAVRYGVRDPFDPNQNLGAGVHYLFDLLKQFHGDVRLAVAAYYTGERRIADCGLHCSRPEVVRYVEEVRRRYLEERRFHSGELEEGAP
jgi:soluble lytic murein transglycosylase-like protein